MNSIFRITSLALAFLLSACGAVIDPASLERAAPGQAIELPGGYAYVSPPAGIYDNQFKYELAAGRYAAELEAAAGTYFRGPAGCVGTSVAASSWKGQALNQVARAEGGVFVPRDPKEAVKIYFYRGAQPVPQLATGTATEIAQRTAPKASVGQSALGAALGGAIVDAIIESERGKIGYMPGAADDSLRAAIRFGAK